MTNLIDTQDISQKFAESLILVELKLSSYGTSKIDKEETKKTLDSNNIKDSSVGKFTKNLLPNASILKELKNLDASIWAIMDRYGAPYTKGVRMIPAAKYMDMMAELRIKFAEREKLVAVFAAEYTALREAAKIDLQTIFKEKDYPDASEVVSKFGASLNVTPVADPRTLKLAVLADAAEHIQEAVNENFKNKAATLAPYLRELLLKPLVELSSRLQCAEAKLYESFFENALDSADKAKALNILEDDQINNAVYAIVDRLRVSKDAVKDDETLRSMVLQDCNTIIESLDGAVPPPYTPKKKTPSASDLAPLQPCPHAEFNPVSEEPLRGTLLHEALASEITDEQIHAVADGAVLDSEVDVDAILARLNG